MLWRHAGSARNGGPLFPNTCASSRAMGSSPTRRGSFATLRDALLILSAVSAVVSAASADERMFGYVLTTDTLPHGQLEQQDTLTAGLGKSRGDYQLYQLATGLDYGITNELQGALFLNTHLVTA